MQEDIAKFQFPLEQEFLHEADFKSPGKHLLVDSHHPHYGAEEQISQSDNSKQT